MPSDDVVREFTRIDPIHSVSEMMAEVVALPEEQRRAVILHGLARSRFQYTWSFLAKEYGPDLIAEVMNTVISKEAPDRWLMRSVHEEVRGVMSDTYRIMDSRPIIESFWKAATDLGAVPFEGTGGDLRWSLRAVIPHVFQPAEDEVLAIVVHLANSDFGKGALTLALEIERILCTNLMTGKNELRKVHLGARLQEGAAYELDTQLKDTEALSLVIRDHVKGVLAAPRVEETMGKIKEAIEEKVDIKAAFTKELPKFGLRKKEIEAAREIYMNASIEELPRGDNRYRMGNALSWVAQNFPDIQPERRMELERTAGKYVLGDGKAGEED